jgi:DNA-directed RNA polymerase III subunit RPC4
MPPKPRGRGSTRARGGGRGGATAGRDVGTGDVADAGEAAPATSTAAPVANMIPQDIAPHDDTNAAAPVEISSAESSAAASAISTPQEGAEAPTRPPVQRLGGLKSADAPSRSASPAIRRGSSTRGKKAAVKPTFTGRRSKEERAALEKEALDRELERNKERIKAENRKAQQKERDAKRDATRATRGRGGYSGAMSGPFSLGSSKEGRFLRPAHGARLTRYRQEGKPSQLLWIWGRIWIARRACQERG